MNDSGHRRTDAQASPSGSGAGDLAILLPARRRPAVPGLSVALIDEQGTRWTGATGLATIRTSTPATPQTIVPWFSMTKIMTATAVLQLTDRGKLDLDAPASRYLPEFAPVPRRANDPPVTVRHLLNHSSGLPNPIPVAWVHPADATGPDNRAFTHRLLARRIRLTASPGGRTAYSNLGYLVLGEVIARASGVRYEDYIRGQLLQPLGMRRTDFVYRDDMVPDAATGYQPRWHPFTPLLRVMLPKGIIGAAAGRFVAFRRFYVNGAAYGGLIGPADDVARLLRLHLNGGTVDGQHLLSAGSVAMMQRISATGSKLDVGLGWFRSRADTRRGRHFLEHLGGGAGFWSVMRLYPEEGVGVVVMGNATRYDHEQVVATVLRQVVGLG